MHELFEIRQVCDHLVNVGGICPEPTDMSDIRVGMALLCLASTEGANRRAFGDAYSRLRQAEDQQLLQVFFDEHGTRRGFAILAFLDTATDAEAKSRPLAVLRDPDRHAGGPNAWLVSLIGGEGQGRAIARNLRDHVLRAHDRLSYVRERDGALLVKSLVDQGSGGFGCRRTLQAPPCATLFDQFTLRSRRALDLSRYARLVARSKSDPVSIATALDRFTHPTALRQYACGGAADREFYVSWAMVGVNVRRRLEAAQGGELHAGDWSSGPTQFVVEALGNSDAIFAALDNREVNMRRGADTYSFLAARSQPVGAEHD